MAAPYPILIRKSLNDGTTTSVINTETVFRMVCSEVPFHFVGNAKDLPENDWYDEDGLEEYIPDTGLRLKGYDMEVTFLYKGGFDEFSGDLRRFITYLTGKDGEGGTLAIYDTYNAVGRQNVRFESIDHDVFIKQDMPSGTDQEIAKFTVKFKVNDPITDITLTE